MPVLEISELTVPISLGVQFERVSCTIPMGSRVALFGGLHSGKDALTLLLTGQRLLPKHAGGITLGGTTCSRTPDYLQQCFFIPETPELPRVAFHYYVETMAKLYPKFNLDRFYAYGELLKLDPERPLKLQPMGLKKKFLLACALASGAPLIICSNIFSHASPVSVQQIAEAIEATEREQHIMLFTGTNLPYLSWEITHLLALHKGRMVLYQEIEQLQKLFSLVLPAERRENRFALEPKTPASPPLSVELFLANYLEIEDDFIGLLSDAGNQEDASEADTPPAIDTTIAEARKREST